MYVVEVTTQEIRDQFASWKVPSDHGLVGTNAQHELKVSIPGHNFGREQVLQKADELLKLTGSQ